MRSVFCLAAFLLILPGCASVAQNPATDNLTVEGITTVRGAEPFTAVVLTTTDRNSYVLKLTPQQRSRLGAPARVRATGRLYIDYWQGMSFAHLEVSRVVLLDQ